MKTKTIRGVMFEMQCLCGHKLIMVPNDYVCLSTHFPLSLFLIHPLTQFHYFFVLVRFCQDKALLFSNNEALHSKNRQTIQLFRLFQCVHVLPIYQNFSGKVPLLLVLHKNFKSFFYRFLLYFFYFSCTGVL